MKVYIRENKELKQTGTFDAFGSAYNFCLEKLRDYTIDHKSGFNQIMNYWDDARRKLKVNKYCMIWTGYYIKNSEKVLVTCEIIDE